MSTLAIYEAPPRRNGHLLSSKLDKNYRRHYLYIRCKPYFTMIHLQKIGGLPRKHEELTSRNRRFTAKVVGSAWKSLWTATCPRSVRSMRLPGAPAVVHNGAGLSMSCRQCLYLALAWHVDAASCRNAWSPRESLAASFPPLRKLRAARTS